ncbi:MAG: HD-like signal output (HDOD) protein [Motiliproteus sp.]|jgi:HD-like signal output (HDOD) protein
MDSPPAPRDLQQWVDLLQDKPLPVPAQTLGLLRRLLQDPEVSLQQLQPIINRDPVLSMHCVSRANRLNRNPDTDVSTVELAVSTLGLHQIIDLASQLPAIKLNSASVPHKQYFHALSNSFHAATQAAMLCRYKDPALINSTRTAALFYGIGHWALWRYAPQQMSQIKIRLYEQHQDTAFAEHEVLGCTIQEISEQLVERWQLSRLAAEALQHAASPDAKLLQQVHLQATQPTAVTDEHSREVKQLLNAIFYPVKLANWLALAVPRGWNHPKSQRIIGLIGDFLQQSPDQTSLSLHQHCVAASHQHPMPGLLSPAALMLLLPSDLVLNYRLNTEDLADHPGIKKQPSNGLPAIINPKKMLARQPPGSNPFTSNKSADSQTPIQVAENNSETKRGSKPDTAPVMALDIAAQAFRDQALYRQCLQQLLRPTLAIQTLEQALKRLQQGAIEGLGLERMLCYAIDPAMQLTPICHQGRTRDDPLTAVTLDLKIPSLLKKMTLKPLAVWAHADNILRIRAELPERFTSACHPRSFALISLFEGKRPALILYADRAQQERVISEFQFKKLKQLAAAAHQCLAQLNKSQLNKNPLNKSQANGAPLREAASPLPIPMTCKEH